MSRSPDTTQLGRWLRSWVQPDGAIHGFHNHSVWGDNPFRYGDFTSGHSTFASPLLVALTHSLRQRPDSRGRELLQRLVRFQTSSFQADGQFDHIGFQVGEMLKWGLIHNVVPCAALSALAGMTDMMHDEIDRAVRGVLGAMDRIFQPGPNEDSCCNQDYCRLWARLLHMQSFGHAEWNDLVARGLDYMIARFHVRGHPDSDCVGTLRNQSDPDGLEPSEYYGLMIHPLLLGYQRFGDEKYLNEAVGIARHCARSSWVDARGQRRAHRLWTTRGTGQWRCLREPMLIGGFGLTLSSIQSLLAIQPDDELSQFLEAMDATYAHYQSNAGFFLAASGWGSEQDIIPSSAWQSHDLMHLVIRHGVDAQFWDTFFSPNPRAAAVFGPSMIWIEAGLHWAVRGYHGANGLQLVGRKDRGRFFTDFPSWVGAAHQVSAEYLMPDEPKFIRDGKHVFQYGGRSDVDTLEG